MQGIFSWILGFGVMMTFLMCKQSHPDSSLIPSGDELIHTSSQRDSSLPVLLQQADSLIQWRNYTVARRLLDSFLLDLAVQPVILRNRAKNMWSYALIRDSAPVDSTPALQILRHLEMTGSREDTLILGQRALNLGFYYQAEPDSAGLYFDQALMYLSRYYMPDDLAMQRYFRDIGSYYFFEANRIQDAIEIFRKEEMLHRAWRYPPSDRFLIAYNLGEAYRSLEDFDLAEHHLHQAIRELQYGKIDTNSSIILPYNALCFVYAQKNASAHLNAYVDTTLLLVQKYLAYDTANHIDYSCGLAMCYTPGYVNTPEYGFAILERIPPYTPQLQRYAAAYGDVYRARAYLYLGQGKLTEAQTAMRRAIELFESAPYLNPYYQSGYLDALLGLGIFYLEDGLQVKNALPYISRASENIFGKPLQEVAMDYPARFLKYYPRWFDYLIAYGDELMYASNESMVLPKLMKLSARIDSAIVTTRQKVSNHDVLRNARLNHDIYTYMIGWCHDVYRETQEDTVLSLAFDHFEKSRAHLLLTHLSASSLAAQLNVPRKVIDDGMALTSEELATYALLSEKEIDALLARKKAYFQSLEKNYPDYYHRSYQPPRTSLAEVQRTLRNDEAIITYQLRDSQLYTLVITPDTLALVKSKFNAACVQRIDMLNKLVHARPSHTWDDTDVSHYAQTAQQVFECVLANISNLIVNKRQWWIAADGILELLPFEILMDEQLPNAKEFQSLPYLVTRFDIGYILSATTWVHEQKRGNPGITDAVAFIHSDGTHTVRSFGFQRDGLEFQGMPGTAKAAASIREVFGKSNVPIYANRKATIPAFIKALNSYDVVHLGLHAYADTTGRQRHGIVFPGDESVLTISDIIGKEIQASVIFLEGCETGVGRQARGEGTLNFARPFIAAGTRHVLASRWKLDDQTAGEMSGYFYRQLKGGQNVAAANCEAKRRFLKRARRLQSHPYYWAAVMSVQ